MWCTTDDEAHCLSHLLTSVTQTAGRRNTCHFLRRWKVGSESHRPCILPHSWHQQQKHLWRVCKLNTKLWSLILAHLKAYLDNTLESVRICRWMLHQPNSWFQEWNDLPKHQEIECSQMLLKLNWAEMKACERSAVLKDGGGGLRHNDVSLWETEHHTGFFRLHTQGQKQPGRLPVAGHFTRICVKSRVEWQESRYCAVTLLLTSINWVSGHNWS